MKLSKLCKRVLSVTLAAALAVGTPIAVGPQKATAAEAPVAVYENDFSKDDPAKGSVKGDGSIHDGVFENAKGGPRENYFLLPENTFFDNSANMNANGVTISFVVNANNNADWWAPIFTAYAAEPTTNESGAKVNGSPMFALLSCKMLQANDGKKDENGFDIHWQNFTDAENKNGANSGLDSFWLDDQKDHVITVTISDEEAVEYVDGFVVNAWNINAGMAEFDWSTLKYICLGGNMRWDAPDQDAGYKFDDLKIYDKALTGSEVREYLAADYLPVAKTFGGAFEVASGENTDYQQLTGNFDVEYEFDTVSTGTSQWENFTLQITDGEGKTQDYRADCYNDAHPFGEVSWTGGVADWAAFQADMQEGAHVIQRVTRKGSTLYVTNKITAKSGTEYNMTATCAGEFPDTLYVRIYARVSTLTEGNLAPATQDIQLSTNSSSELTLSEIIPGDVTGTPEYEITSGEGVVEVTPSAGKVSFKGLKNGTATVTVTDSATNLSFSCKVTVSDIAATGVKLSDTEVTLKKGETKTVTADPEPESVTDKTVSWVSSDEKVATVADGTITAVGAGTATITATIGAASATITVTVTDDTEKPEETEKPGTTDTPGGSTSGTAIAVESVALDKTADELEIGASTTLTATVTPDNATDKDVTWSSSDAKVATVDATGKVTAVAAGTATITVTSKSNEKATATCTITVKAPASTDNNDNNDNNNDNTGNNTGNTDVNTGNGNDNNDANTGNDQTDDEKEPEATTATVTNTSGVKETVKTTDNGTATVTKVKSSKKSVTVSSTVKVNGVKYTVTAVAANAFAKCKNVTKVTLPATIKTFKKKAFTGAKKVKTIVVKSKKAITVKKGAFKGVNTKKMTIKAGKMSKKQLKKFKKSLKKAGFQGKVKK